MSLKRFVPARLGLVVGAVAVMGLLFGSAVQAQAPSYAVRQPSITGTVRSFDGAYTMYVRDEHGDLDRVQLHQGTIINPTGLHLEGGMHVTVYGHAAGDVFIADEIDTPYHFNRYYGYPYYPYPYWGWGIGWGWGWGGWGWRWR